MNNTKMISNMPNRSMFILQAQLPLGKSRSVLTTTLGSLFSLVNSTIPAMAVSPQSLLQATLPKPLSPHWMPHWFLISQLLLPSSYPTSSTAWLSNLLELAGQLFSTPPPQSISAQSAYIPIITGPYSFSNVFNWRIDMEVQVTPQPLPTIIRCVSLQMPGVCGKPVSLVYDPAVQGQAALRTLPTVAKKASVSGKYPPPQLFSLWFGAQQEVHSRAAYSERPKEKPRSSNCDSYMAVPAKDQHEPQEPWSLTDVTIPFRTQFRKEGRGEVSVKLPLNCTPQEGMEQVLSPSSSPSWPQGISEVAQCSLSRKELSFLQYLALFSMTLWQLSRYAAIL